MIIKNNNNYHYLLDMQKKYSRQREAIKRYLTGNDTHPTADEVYYQVRQEYPNISLATVYRNLHQMSEDGEIRRICCGSDPDHYDFRTEEHGHFLCGKCHRVFDVMIDYEEVAASHGPLPGTAGSCEIIYYGTCSACAGDGNRP